MVVTIVIDRHMQKRRHVLAQYEAQYVMLYVWCVCQLELITQKLPFIEFLKWTYFQLPNHVKWKKSVCKSSLGRERV